jgi:hypothetical protein
MLRRGGRGKRKTRKGRTVKKKKSLPPLFFKRKKPNASLVHIGLSNWVNETFLYKSVCHYFWHGLMEGAQIVSS